MQFNKIITSTMQYEKGNWRKWKESHGNNMEIDIGNVTNMGMEMVRNGIDCTKMGKCE